MDFTLEALQAVHWPQVAAIYQDGIATKIATFQDEVPTWEQWDKGHSKACRIIAKRGDEVLGWAALTPVSDRCVYAGVANVSIYIGQPYKHQGVGKALMRELIRQSEEAGFWTLESKIIAENTASLALHAACGFRLVGTREKLGKMDTGIWHDVVLVERRSQIVGLD